jgi:hypothetical protein
MKGAHYRRRPLGSNVEKMIYVLGMTLFGTGIGIAVSDAQPDDRVSSIRSEATTTTTEATTTTTTVVEATTTTALRRALFKRQSAGNVTQPADKRVVPTTSSTTSTESAKTPLEVALKYLGII